jgi:hypothetical protein
MADKTGKAPIRIELTSEQKEQIKQATGQEVVAVELAPESLEERVAPGISTQN